MRYESQHTRRCRKHNNGSNQTPSSNIWENKSWKSSRKSWNIVPNIWFGYNVIDEHITRLKEDILVRNN